jgi:hypothetical protein
MNRKVWKWLFGISVGVLILLVLLTFGFWVLVNIGGAILLSLMGNTEIAAMPFSVFMSNFVGSPMFYIYLADLIVLMGASLMLMITKQRQK